MRILVVDDEAHIRKLVGRILEQEGYEVVLAENGREAIDIFEETNPDLIILDISMPVVDGFGVLEYVRKISKVPVIMLTAMGEAVKVNNAFSIGADDYIRKPFHKQELMARIKAKIRRAEL